jgi:p-methyltransferase
MSKKKFHEICTLLKQYELNWFSFLRCSDLDEETVRLMKESGCKGNFVGFESGDGEILRNMNKKASVYEYQKGIEYLKKYGIFIFGSFILGFPGETEKSIKSTLNFIETSGIDFYTLNVWWYFHFTPIHDLREKYNLQGVANNWSHRTMDSTQTLKHYKHLFKEIRNPVYAPATIDSVFWSIIYYLDRGFSLDQIKKIFTIYSKFLELNLDKKDNDQLIKDNLLKELSFVIQVASSSESKQ